MSRAFREGAKVYQTALAEKAPEKTDDIPGGDSLPPGALKSDVLIHKAEGTGGPIYTVGFGKLTAHVARFVDRGHKLVTGGRSRVGRKSKKKQGRQIGFVKPHPFFREAFEQASEPAAKTIMNSLSQSIRKAFKGK